MTSLTILLQLSHFEIWFYESFSILKYRTHYKIHPKPNEELQEQNLKKMPKNKRTALHVQIFSVILNNNGQGD